MLSLDKLLGNSPCVDMFSPVSPSVVCVKVTLDKTFDLSKMLKVKFLSGVTTFLHVFFTFIKGQYGSPPAE